MQWLMNAIERFTGALRSIDNDHAYIHAGKMFTAFFQLTIASAAVNKLTFKTPATNSGKTIHFRPAKMHVTADKITVKIYEGSSGNSGGTAMTAVNRDRNSATTSLVTELKTGVTVTTMGTQIDMDGLGGGTAVGGNTLGATAEAKEELVLKPDTLYTIEITNGSSASNIVTGKLLWYEE